MWWIEEGDSAQVLKMLPTASVDALVTDPPAGISFMGADWDGNKGGRDKWIAWLAGILTECRRAMKSGSYGWVWALPKTAHWTATACEDAGFAVRDVLAHVFGTGFPKSKASLKPAAEHWILIKAPGELRELRIEESRIGTKKQVPASAPLALNQKYGARPKSAIHKSTAGYDATIGRWPTNFALSHTEGCEVANPDCYCIKGCPVKTLDEQAGERKPRVAVRHRGVAQSHLYGEGMGALPKGTPDMGYGGGSNASRFFYTAKPSTRERSTGLTDRNTHPTVKSINLMRHLVRLIAAPSSTILDPFTGSGSTGIAALQEGCHFIGIEQEPKYVDIARQRLHHEDNKTAGITK